MTDGDGDGAVLRRGGTGGRGEGVRRLLYLENGWAKKEWMETVAEEARWKGTLGDVADNAKRRLRVMRDGRDGDERRSPKHTVPYCAVEFRIAGRRSRIAMDGDGEGEGDSKRKAKGNGPR